MTILGRWFTGFGLFLIVCGVAGFASNPVAAKTALITGSLFGSLAIALGFCFLKGWSLTRYGALALCLLLVSAFTWRSIASWQAFAAGEPKLFAASLITAMWVATVLSLIQLFRFWKKG
jgi:hypothetical protein